VFGVSSVSAVMPTRFIAVYIDVRAEPEKFQFVIKDPKDPNFYPWEEGGWPLTPEQAAQPGTDEIQKVSIFIIQRPRKLVLFGTCTNLPSLHIRSTATDGKRGVDVVLSGEFEGVRVAYLGTDRKAEA
jgi:hypothetical protein